MMSPEEVKSIRQERDRLRKRVNKNKMDPASRILKRIKNAQSQRKCRTRRAKDDPDKAASFRQRDRDRKKEAHKKLQDAVKKSDADAIEKQRNRKKQKHLSYLNKSPIISSVAKESGSPPYSCSSLRALHSSLRHPPTDEFKEVNYKPGCFKTASWMQMQQAKNRIAWDKMSSSLKELHPLYIRKTCKSLQHTSETPCKKEAYNSWKEQYEDFKMSVSNEDAFANHEAFQEMLVKSGVSDTHKFMREVQLLPFYHPVLSKERTSTNFSDMWTEGIPDMFCNKHRQRGCRLIRIECLTSTPSWYSKKKPKLTHNA